MNKSTVMVTQITQSIHLLRGQKIMLDFDLAGLYVVPTGHLNRAVKRNVDRFPGDFMWRLTGQELRDLKCQIGISSWGGSRSRPYAFTEQGVAMRSSVLRSTRAVKVNIAIMRAFVQLRATVETSRELARKFSELENRVDKHDTEIAAIIDAIRQLMVPPKKSTREIGFHVRETSPRYRFRRRR